MTLSRESMLARVFSRYNSAEAQAWLAHDDRLLVSWNPADWAQFKSQYFRVNYCLQHIINALKYLTDQNLGDYTYWYLIPEYLNFYTIPFELSAEDIVTAWFEADTQWRLYTCLAIDRMRKDVWNESVSDWAAKEGFIYQA